MPTAAGAAHHGGPRNELGPDRPQGALQAERVAGRAAEVDAGLSFGRADRALCKDEALSPRCHFGRAPQRADGRGLSRRGQSANRSAAEGGREWGRSGGRGGLS